MRRLGKGFGSRLAYSSLVGVAVRRPGLGLGMGFSHGLEAYRRPDLVVDVIVSRLWPSFRNIGKNNSSIFTKADNWSVCRPEAARYTDGKAERQNLGDFMKNSIDAATAHAMESIKADPVVSSHVGGKLGKLMKSGMAGMFIAGAMLMGAANPVMAQANNSINAGCVLGGLAGGLLGNQMGGGDGKTILTAAGAVLGCKSGQEVQANSEYRNQQQAGYGQQGGGYAQPGYQRGPQYQQPVVQSAHPMGNYMQHTFAQLNGQEAPSRDLTVQERMAMDKTVANAENFMNQNLQAQQNYANAYQAKMEYERDMQNPVSNALRGNVSQQDLYKMERDLNQASNAKSQTNVNFGSAGMRMADVAEYIASTGGNITGYGERIQHIMSAPMSAPVTGINPSQQRVTFATSATPMQGQVPNYQQQRRAGY